MAKLAPGARINNYLLLEQVGRGTFGEVWKARHHVWADQLVAVKVPTDEQYVRTLQKEGMVVHGLVHPNIVRVVDLDPFADVPYLILEYVDGRSLRDLLTEKTRLDVDTAADFLRQILSGLESAHAAGIVHRDVKPANILISRDGVVKIADFGLGRVSAVTTQSLLISGSLQTFEGKSISGTLAYMAPEQAEGGPDAGAPADLYAAGIVFYEMLTGTRPAGMDAPSDLVPELPKWVDEVFRRAYTRLERRYRSAGEMLAALETARNPPPKPPAEDDGILILSDDADGVERGGDRRDRGGMVFLDENEPRGSPRPVKPPAAPAMLFLDEGGRRPPPPTARPAARDDDVFWLNEPPRAGPGRTPAPTARPRPEPFRFEPPPSPPRPRPTPPKAPSARPAPVAEGGGHHCPSCAHPVSPGDNFCMKCGRQMVGSIRRCERCGGYPGAGDEFCIYCGHRLIGRR